MPALYILQHTSPVFGLVLYIHFNLYLIHTLRCTHSLVHACFHWTACEHTCSMTLFCQSSGCAATYSILIIVRGRSDSHQRSLPIKLHGLCSINDRLHTSTWRKGRSGKDVSHCKLNLCPCGPSSRLLRIPISKVIWIIYTHPRWS